MTEEKKLCKCGLAAFGYANTTDRLKFFLNEARKSPDSRNFAAFVGQQLEEYLYKMDEFCGLELADAISKAKSIRSILKEEKEKPLDFHDYLVVEGLFNELDPLVVPDLKKCAEDPREHLPYERLRESTREYLPHGLTEEEKADPVLLKKLSSCIEDVEKKSCPESALKPDGKYDYSKCEVNPVAACRSSIEKS